MKIKIRNIIKKDIKKIFNLRNDSLTRKFSKNPKKILYQDHKKWFAKTIKIKKNYFYVALLNKKIIGYIRYDKLGFFYKISISLDKTKREKGFSNLIIDLLEKKINKNIVTIAEVKKTNKSAINMFIKSKYKKISSDKNFISFCKIIDHQNKFFEGILSTIEKIKNVRSKNNVNWMNILEIAFKNDPYGTSLIFKNIQSSDVKISKLSKKLI